MPQPGHETKPPTELRLRMCPDLRARIDGSTARDTFNVPSTFTAKAARTSSAVTSSTAPTRPRPALLTRTSIWPNCFSAASTASLACCSLVTSSFNVSRRSCLPKASSIVFGFLAVATTVPPAPNAAFVSSIPKPFDAPVMNQSFRAISISPFRWLKASLVVEPLIHRLDLFFSEGWKQVIDSHIRRGYQDRLGMRKRIIAIFPVIMSDAGRSHSSVRHGLNEHEDIGLIYGAPAERKRLQHAIDRLLILAEQVDSKRSRERLDLRE